MDLGQDATGEGSGGGRRRLRRPRMRAIREIGSSRATHIWWGPIASERQAREIVAWTGWSSLLIGLAPVAALTMAAARGDLTFAAPFYADLGDNRLVIGQLLFIAVELSAAVILLRRRSAWAAATLLGCCLLVIGLLARLALGGLAAGAAQRFGLGDEGLLALCLLLLARLAWRAVSAARALRGLEMLEHFA